MTPREIIAQAWAITTKQRPLWRWGFASSLFETLRSVELILYQAYFLYWYFKGASVGWLSVEVLFFDALPFSAFLTITIILIALIPLEMFVPTLANGAIIGLSAKAYRKEELKGGLLLGLTNFFPILEVHGLFVLSSFTTIFTVSSLLLRYGGTGNFKYVTITVVLILWVFASLFRFFASFAEEGIVIQKLGAFGGVGKSFKLIVSYLGHVMFLFLLLFVISLRILMNAAMVLIVPGIIVGLSLLLTLFLSPAISYMIGGIVGLVLIVIASYFFAYLHIFKQTVWTITYLELSQRKALDVILEE